MSSINFLRLPMQTARQQLRTARPSLRIQIRPLHQSGLSYQPQKNAQDKDSINTDSNEYSKSGSDSQAAQQDDPSFNPNKTDPEQQKERAGEDGNPLEVSPANKDVSSGTKSEQAERGGSAEKSAGSKKSGHGSPQKGGKV